MRLFLKRILGSGIPLREMRPPDMNPMIPRLSGTLSGQLLAVYEMMLENVDTGAWQPERKELARRWGKKGDIVVAKRPQFSNDCQVLS